MSRTVLVTTPRLASEGEALLAEAGCRVLYVGAEDGAGDMARLLASEPVEAVISRTLPLGREAILSCPSLKVISRHGVGHDNVDVAAATERGIPVTVADGTNVQSVAELAMGMMFSVARAIPRLDRAVRKGQWPRSGSGLQLSGRTLGLVGYGRIARALAAMARAAGMEILVHDPHLQTPAVDIEVSGTLDGLLDRADVVSLHCPATDETRNIIDARAIARMRRGAILINTARGELIEENALIEALRSGYLAGAGLDTFAREPLGAGHPLLDLPGAVLTPHMGGSTDAALAETARSAVRNALAVLEGRPLDPRLIVNPETLDREEIAS